MRRISTSKVTKPKGGTSLDVGRRVLDIEARAVQALVQRLDGGFSEAVDLLYRCKGKVVVSGMGKSGLIGQKIAATLASTGTPSFFLHPAEGLHGDLGMLARLDVLIAISNSGETQEILQLLPFMERMGIPVVAIVGRKGSTLAKNSAVALLEKRGFKEQDFAQFHPGGTLGRRLLVKVRDLMHKGQEVPQVGETVLASVAILEMSAKKLGMTTVVDRAGALLGVITDGDLRRFLQQGGDFSKITAGSLASRRPKLIGPDELAAKAVEMMERYAITTLVVADNAKRIIGVVHLHDLLKHGIV